MTESLKEELDFLLHDEEIEQAFAWNEALSLDISAFLEWSEQYTGYQYRTLVQHGGLEFVYATEEAFKTFGISGQELAGCVDGDLRSIRNTCRKILRQLETAKNLESKGQTHLISRKLEPSKAAVHMLVLAAFDGMERYDSYRPIPELHYLLKELLAPGVPTLEKARKANQFRSNALFIAAEALQETGKIPSMRRIAEISGRNVSTVSRMFGSTDEYERDVHSFHRFLQSRPNNKSSVSDPDSD